MGRVDHHHIKAGLLAAEGAVGVCLHNVVDVVLVHLLDVLIAHILGYHGGSDGVGLLQQVGCGAPSGVAQLHGQLGPVAVDRVRHALHSGQTGVFCHVNLTVEVAAGLVVDNGGADGDKSRSCAGLHGQEIPVLRRHLTGGIGQAADHGRKLDAVLQRHRANLQRLKHMGILFAHSHGAQSSLFI